MYVHPLIYEFGIQFLYWGGLRKLRSLIRGGSSVFEPACGYGRIHKYLPPDSAYRGIDLNETFIRYGQKKGLTLALGNIFDEGAYPDSDVVLLCDILHHLPDDKMRHLIELALRHCREKLIIVEPAFVSMASSSHFMSRFLSRFFSLADADGINDINRWLSTQEYQNLFAFIEALPQVTRLRYQKHRFHYFVEVLLT
jgi:SAM-dependent methyltransferase